MPEALLENLPEKFNQPEHTQPPETIITPEMARILARHVVDIEPHNLGRRELLRNMAGALVGTAETSVQRAHPSLEIDRLTLNPGDLQVLIGPNGAGKSTLFDAIMERDQADFGTEQGTGAVTFGNPVRIREKLRIARLDQEEILDDIGHFTVRQIFDQVKQYFQSQFPEDWEKYDYEEIQNNEAARDRIDQLITQIAILFKVNEFLDRQINELSGGERTKLALFSILASEPDVLLLDEPTNHLDLKSIAKLTGLFTKYKEAGVSVLCISHIDWFLRAAGRDGTLEVKWDKNQRVATASNKPYAGYEKNRARERVPVISQDIAWLQKDYKSQSGASLLEMPLTFTIPNSPLDHVSFPNIQGGDLTLITGENGTGKTKLFETIQESPDPQLPKKAKGVQLAYLPQFWPDQVANGTIAEFFDWIKAEASPHSTGSAEHPSQPPLNLFLKRAKELQFGGSNRIGETWLNKPLHTLSGGEQRILWFLAVSSLRDIDLLMLDEPTNHMDSDLQMKVLKTIQTFPGGVMVATHDLNLIKALAHDSGSPQGRTRFPHHLTFEKNNGRTAIKRQTGDAAIFITKEMAAAQAEADQIKI